MLKETRMTGCKPIDAQMEFNAKLGNSVDKILVDKEKYWHLKGKVRPNIFYAVSIVSQFMQAPYKEHMVAVNCILRYLKTTPGKGLMFRKTDRKCIKVCINFDCAGSITNKKSTIGYYTFV